MNPTNTYPGILHPISPPLVAFEHRRNLQSQASNILIFLGGLSDGLLTVPYVPHIVSSLPPFWALIEPTLSSSYRQFGISSLGKDVAEIAQLVEYVQKLHPNGKVVLFGHSTGSQQVMHYCIAPGSRPKIHGAVFQAGISDREALTAFAPSDDYQSTCAVAQSYISDSRGEDILPFKLTSSFFQTVPMSARRWISLASPGPAHEGEDDFFSSDFDDERLSRIFEPLGKMGKRITFLYSGSDQYVPSPIDKSKLVEKWHEHVKRGGGVVDEGSGVVRGQATRLRKVESRLKCLSKGFLVFSTGWKQSRMRPSGRA